MVGVIGKDMQVHPSKALDPLLRPILCIFISCKYRYSSDRITLLPIAFPYPCVVHSLFFNWNYQYTYLIKIKMMCTSVTENSSLKV